MSNSQCSIFFSLLCIMLVCSCARVNSTLGGGEKDESAPGILTEYSTENMQTQWDGSPVSIQFNEWVKLQNKSQIIVSPPLEETPEINLKRKTLTFELHPDEVLRDSTTYVINFGESIVDFTEGNPAENLTYVFSTGDVIDSLEVTGRVIDAITREPIEGVNIQLYDDLADTVLTTSRPYYLGRTNESGGFKISNIKNDTFQIYALLDNNLNFTYDGPPELVAFADSTLVMKYDSTVTQSVELLMFSESSSELLDVRHHHPQKLCIAMTAEPQDHDILCNNSEVIYQEWQKDTLFVWFDSPLDTNSIVTLSLDEVTDTLNWRKPKTIVDSLMYLQSLSPRLPQTYPSSPLELRMSNPIDSLDLDFFSLKDTSEQFVKLEVTHKGRDIFIEGIRKAKEQYILNLFPGAVKDIYGQVNDSLELIFVTKGSDQFSKVNLTFTPPDTIAQYVFELYDEKQKKVREYTFVGNSTQSIDALAPGNYNAKIIEDQNNNGRWDTGSYEERRFPEIVKQVKIEGLREDWDIELTIDWDSIE